MTTSKNVVIEAIPTNPNCKIFHVRKPLFDAHAEHIIKWERNAQAFEDYYTAPAIFELIGERCPGVQGLFSPKCYKVFVERGRAFTWEEIEPMLIEILNAYCG